MFTNTDNSYSIVLFYFFLFFFLFHENTWKSPPNHFNVQNLMVGTNYKGCLQQGQSLHLASLYLNILQARFNHFPKDTWLCWSTLRGSYFKASQHILTRWMLVKHLLDWQGSQTLCQNKTLPHLQTSSKNSTLPMQRGGIKSFYIRTQSFLTKDWFNWPSFRSPENMPHPQT